MNNELVSRSVKLFQMVLRYMGVDSSEKTTQMDLEEQIGLVGKIYKHTLKRAELRDELFIQLSKQTRNNPERYLIMPLNADRKKLIPYANCLLPFQLIHGAPRGVHIVHSLFMQEFLNKSVGAHVFVRIFHASKQGHWSILIRICP